MEEVTNSKKKIEDNKEKLNKDNKIKEKSDTKKESKKEKIKNFIEKGKKEKKILYKDIVKFVDSENITPEEMAKIKQAQQNNILDKSKNKFFRRTKK